MCVFFILLAPSIYENEDIKKGILLQLFGGTSKDFTMAGRGKFRYVCLTLKMTITDAVVMEIMEIIIV